MSNHESKSAYEWTYDLRKLSPWHVGILNRRLRRAEDMRPVEALSRDINHLSAVDFYKALNLISFLSNSRFKQDRAAAALAIPNLLIEAEQSGYDDRVIEVVAVWAHLLENVVNSLPTRIRIERHSLDAGIDEPGMGLLSRGT